MHPSRPPRPNRPGGRIWPAIRGLSGLVGVHLLRQRDLGALVVHLATSLETLEAADRAVLATDLLPGEDPALLAGPDRLEIHHVTAHHMPAVTRPVSAKGH